MKKWASTLVATRLVPLSNASILEELIMAPIKITFSDSTDGALKTPAAANSPLKPSLTLLREERNSMPSSKNLMMPQKTLINRSRPLRLRQSRSLTPALRSSRTELTSSRTITTLSSAKLLLMSSAATHLALTPAPTPTTSSSMKSLSALPSASAPR